MKTVYSDIKKQNNEIVRLCGILDSDAEMVHVHIVNGSRLGGFNLTRFEGSKLTSKTLNKLFTND